ncbi:MAG: flagellar biosynthetic protein FliR [Paracoccaceae bacterium]|nr:MAG: flagellar biosynthetic protein FliR [Paracoccaceae bacterium]
MALLPAFGEQSVPVRIRLALTLAFTLVCAPAITDRPLPAPGFMAIGVEVAAGLAVGAGLRLMIVALQVAGTIAATATSLSQVFGGVGGEPQPAMANLLAMAGLALAVSVGLHVNVARLIIGTYEIVPAGQMPDAAGMAAWGLARVAQSFGLAFTLAAPFVIAATVYNLALGVINRAMPQLMVAFVGAPALTLGGLALLAVVAPLLLSVWLGAMQDHLATPFGQSGSAP